MPLHFLKYIQLFFLFAFAGKLCSTHIVGGEVLYSHLGNNKYEIRLHLFIDCVNGNPGAIFSDETALFYVFDPKSGNLLPGFPMPVHRKAPERLVKLHYNCLANAPNACVDFYVYDTTLTLPPLGTGYIVSFQRCCRNNSITNLQDPGAQGANYWAEIPDISAMPDGKQNSSAEFKLLPPNFLCTNAFLQFDHSATDADGDSLAYDLFQPYIGGTASQPRPDNGGNGLPEHPPFSRVTWLSNYSETNPIDGAPPLQINPNTGKLTLLPTRAGQYVAGIRVREYRNGNLIGETRRDYQFNVSDCNLTIMAGPGGDQRLCDNHATLQNNSTGALRYSWDFGVPGTNSDTSNLKFPEFDYPKPGVYQVKLLVFKNNCSDSAISEVRVGTKIGGTALVNTVNCSRSVELIAETEAPKVLWILDLEELEGKVIKQKTTLGNHTALAIFVDTIASCNDTITFNFELTEQANDLRLANVFTPDDDGKNDCYRIGGDIGNCAKGRLKIFNRWGERVFFSEDLSACWNGKVNNDGAQLPEGTYFYMIDLELPESDNGRKSLSGCIELIR